MQKSSYYGVNCYLLEVLNLCVYVPFIIYGKQGTPPVLTCPVRYVVGYVTLGRICNGSFCFNPAFWLLLFIRNDLHICLHHICKQISSFTLDFIWNWNFFCQIVVSFIHPKKQTCFRILLNCYTLVFGPGCRFLFIGKCL